MIKLSDIIYYEINNGKKRGLLKTFLDILLNSSKSAIIMYRISSIFYQKGHKILAQILKKKLEKTYGLHISLKAQISLGITIPHALGIVIGDGVEIGKNVTIYQQVTIGGKNIGDSKKKNYPIISDGVVIYAGSKILGNLKIGKNAVIGANSVVLKDVEENSVYAGIPAKKIR